MNWINTSMSSKDQMLELTKREAEIIRSAVAAYRIRIEDRLKRFEGEEYGNLDERHKNVFDKNTEKMAVLDRYLWETEGLNTKKKEKKS